MSIHVVEITESNFEQEVLNHKGTAIIDFWAEWCGPCKQFTPIIEEFAAESTGKIKVCKLNVDESPEIASQYGIRSIPTIILFKDGKQIATRVGSLPKAQLGGWIDQETA